MATYLAAWGAPGPKLFTAPVVIQPVIPSVPFTAISDTPFRRKKRKQKYQLEQIGKPAVPVSVIRVPDASTDPKKIDFQYLAQISGTSLDQLRTEIDREIADLMRKAQEDDDEEAFAMILTALED